MGDEEQQPATKHNKNREQWDLPKTTLELHQDAEAPSGKNEVEQSDTAPGQPTVQEGGAEAMLGDASKLQGNHPAGSHQTHQQRNTVIKEEEKRKSNKTPVGNQKEETATAIPSTLIQN